MNDTTNDPNPADFIDFPGLAKRIPYSHRQLRTLIATGVIPSIQLPTGRKLIFDWPAVAAAIRRHSNGKAIV